MIDTSKDPQNAEAIQAAAANSASLTHSMLTNWAQRQAHKILGQLELKKARQTLTLHWGKIKQGWHGGFVSGVHAGFQLGYQAANKLSEGFLDRSNAAIQGNEIEVIKKANEDLEDWLDDVISSVEFRKETTVDAVKKLMARFATPLPEVQPAEAEQESLPGIE